MNWGYKIAIVIGVFLAGMLGMVYYASIQTNDMIDDNYYQKELEYQQVIDAQKNLAAITSDNIMSQSMFDVVITLPLGTFEQMVKGQVLKGIFVLFATIFGFALFIIPGFIIWIWQIMDAYNSN